MLRRRLLARLGVLVLGFVLGAVVSIVLLQGVLKDLDAMNADAKAMINGTQSLSLAIASVESLQAPGPTLDEQRRRLALEIEAHFRKLGEHPHLRASASKASADYASVLDLLPAFVRNVESNSVPPADSLALQRRVLQLGQSAREFVAAEQEAVSRNLRTLIIGLTIAALAMMNITVVVLLRTAQMILRPIDELVQASRRLGQEQYHHRVSTDQRDEFAELAHAYNRLADELAANEKRKVEAMQQLAVTLNHELNNVLNIIDFQLSLLDRKSGGDPALAKIFRDIRENLARISSTVASLKSVRRVVLTDYLPGEKMIDLARSLALDDLPSPPSNAPEVASRRPSHPDPTERTTP